MIADLQHFTAPCLNCGKEATHVVFFGETKNNLCHTCQNKEKEKLGDIKIKEEKKIRLNIKEALKKINVNFVADLKLVAENATINKIQTELRNVCQNFNRGFYLLGIPGSGKTTNMQVFAHYMLYSPDKSKKFRNFQDFIFTTESIYISKVFSRAIDDFSWNFQQAVYHELKNKRFIFIDELASKDLTDKELQILDLTIHYIDEQRDNIKLFITSNKSLNELENHYAKMNDSDSAKRIVSRLYHLVTPLKLDEIDYRKI
jgi:DNA replication protein DnaC